MPKKRVKTINVLITLISVVILVLVIFKYEFFGSNKLLGLSLIVAIIIFAIITDRFTKKHSE